MMLDNDPTIQEHPCRICGKPSVGLYRTMEVYGDGLLSDFGDASEIFGLCEEHKDHCRDFDVKKPYIPVEKLNTYLSQYTTSMLEQSQHKRDFLMTLMLNCMAGIQAMSNSKYSQKVKIGEVCNA